MSNFGPPRFNAARIKFQAIFPSHPERDQTGARRGTLKEIKKKKSKKNIYIQHLYPLLTLRFFFIVSHLQFFIRDIAYKFVSKYSSVYKIDKKNLFRTLQEI